MTHPSFHQRLPKCCSNLVSAGCLLFLAIGGASAVNPVSAQELGRQDSDIQHSDIQDSDSRESNSRGDSRQVDGERPGRTADASELSSKTVANQTQHWCDLLVSKQFADRELATERLFQLGIAALPTLRKCLEESRDEEQADRLTRIIDSLAVLDLEARIESFLKGRDSDLSNWSEVKKWFGDSPRVRELFVDLYREYPEAVQSLGKSRQEVSIALTAVKQRMMQRGIGPRETPRRVDLLALLLPLTSPGTAELVDSEYDSIVSSLLQLYPTADLGKDRVLGQPFLRMINDWMGGSDIAVREQVLRLALQLRLDGGLNLALNTIRPKLSPTLLCRCLQVIARQGNRGHISLAAKFIDDPRIVLRKRFSRAHGGDVVVGDVAAATVAYLSSVPVTKIGFAEPAEHSDFGIVYEDLLIKIDPVEGEDLTRREDAVARLARIEEARQAIHEEARKLVPAADAGVRVQ